MPSARTASGEIISTLHGALRATAEATLPASDGGTLAYAMASEAAKGWFFRREGGWGGGKPLAERYPPTGAAPSNPGVSGESSPRVLSRRWSLREGRASCKRKNNTPESVPSSGCC